MSIIKSKLGGKLLQPLLDEETGVYSYNLFNPSDRLQQNFYFTSASMTSDDRFLVFMSCDPEDKRQSLYLADFGKEIIRPILTKGFDVESAIVDEKRGKIWYTRDGVCYGVNLEDEIPDREEVLFTFPEELTTIGNVEFFSNHITFNGNNDRAAYCGRVGNMWYIGYYDLNEKKNHIIYKSKLKSTHVQFAPDNSNRIMFCHDWWISPETGHIYDWDHRLWVYDDLTQQVRQIYYYEHEKDVPHKPFHEFWKNDGSCIYLCDMPHGVIKHYPNQVEQFEVVWAGPHCHAHCNSKGTHFVSDIDPYEWAHGGTAKVAFYNHLSKKEGLIAANLPRPKQYPLNGRHFHPHPHPTFSPSDKWILYTNTKNGNVNLCIADVEDIF